jgi:hypothetical protein
MAASSNYPPSRSKPSDRARAPVGGASGPTLERRCEKPAPMTGAGGSECDEMGSEKEGRSSRRRDMVAAVTAAMIGWLAPAATASFVPLARFDCGSVGTFYSRSSRSPRPAGARVARLERPGDRSPGGSSRRSRRFATSVPSTSYLGIEKSCRRGTQEEER